MVIRAGEPRCVLRPERVEALMAELAGEGFSAHHIIGFTFFAVSGLWQAQFQMPGTPITKAETRYAMLRVARAFAQILFEVPRGAAATAFDRLTHAAVELGDAQEAWSREFEERGVGILDRARQRGATKEDRHLASIWWDTRRTFWLERDIGSMYKAARYAHRVLELGQDDESLQARLIGMRDDLLESKGIYLRWAKRSIGVGGWTLRDLICKRERVRRPRPDRRKVSAPAEFDEEDQDRVDERAVHAAASSAIAAEISESLVRWVNKQLKTAKKGSSRRAILLEMRRRPCEGVRVRELARRKKLSPAAISQALKRLLPELKEFMDARDS